MFTLVAWYQSIDPAGVFTTINAVQDPHVTTNGVDVRVPKGMGSLIGAQALINDASGIRAQIRSPSLRQIANVDLEPIVLANVFGSPPEVNYHPANPIPLVEDESLDLAVQSDPAAAADHYGLAWLADGPQDPLAGPVYTLRATTGAVGAVGVWTNTNLVFGDTLPVGRYRVVGMRARALTAVAARLVFVGNPWRPGVPVVNAIADLDVGLFRFGRAGAWGEFDQTNPPTVDILGATGAGGITALLDLQRLGA